MKLALPRISWPTLVGFVFGLGLGWVLWHPKAPVVETYAPAVVQKDSSVVLERKPNAAAKPKQVIPHGSTVERVVSVTVQPGAKSPARETNGAVSETIGQDRATESPFGATNTADSATHVAPPLTVIPACPPVTVDLTLVRMPDRTRRVIASSPDGEVVGVDIPVESAAPQRILKWAAGPSWAQRQVLPTGAFVDRDLGPARIGISVHRVRDSTAFQERPNRRAPTRTVGYLNIGLRF